jgi:lipoyl-dependent peroxiredoxin
MMPTRTARTAWNGGLQDGSGQVELTSSGVGTYDVSFPKRAADDADGTTSPEELVAAAHSACYAMQFSALLAEAGGTPQSLEVKADVSLGPDEANGGFKLTGILLTVRGEVDGLDEAGFQAAAEKAKAGCPISKALAGVDITLDAALES